MADREYTLARILRERRHVLSYPDAFLVARAVAHATEIGLPDDAYPPEAIAFLVGLKPRRRDPDDPVVRWAREFLDDRSPAVRAAPDVPPELRS